MAGYTSDFSSPTASSPSPHSLDDSTTSPSWFFPGPSSRYHKRERPSATLHTRWKSTYTPVGPVLSTERRARQRAQSSAHVACLAEHSLTSNSTSSSTTLHPDLRRSPLGRFASYPTCDNTTVVSPTMPSSNTASASFAEPVTPAKHSSASLSNRVQDSPFSDYFTDDGRSPSNGHRDSTSIEDSSETQQLLVRLHKLQSQLIHSESDHSANETLHIVGRKLREIDLELNALHSQTRLPADLEDSGLFLDDEDDEHKTLEGTLSESGNGLGISGSDTDVYDEPESPLRRKMSAAQKKAEFDHQLLEAQRVLLAVSTAQEQLRQRHAELRELNDLHMLQIEEREQELERLRSENEALKSDLGFDHSELLFLRLQFKALEVEVDALEPNQEVASDDDAQSAADAADSTYSSRPSLPRRSTVQEELDRWRKDWQDVDTRFEHRRSKYGVLSAKQRPLKPAHSSDDEDDWRLETVKKSHGRVQSITIRRATPAEHSITEEEPLTLDGSNDADLPITTDEDEQDTRDVLSPSSSSPSLSASQYYSEAESEPFPAYVDPSESDLSSFLDEESIDLAPVETVTTSSFSSSQQHQQQQGQSFEDDEQAAAAEAEASERQVFRFYDEEDNECAVFSKGLVLKRDQMSEQSGEEREKTTSPWSDLLEGLANLGGASWAEE